MLIEYYYIMILSNHCQFLKINNVIVIKKMEETYILEIIYFSVYG